MARGYKIYFWENYNGELLPYYALGSFIGFLVAGATFLCSWWWCIANYGFLFGFGLGWLPAFIIAGALWIAAIFLWPVLLLGMLGGVAIVIMAIQKG